MIFTSLQTVYIGESFEGEQKFIVSRYPAKNSNRMYLFNFYGVDLWDGLSEEPRHEKIVQGFKLNPEDVLGGGRVRRAFSHEIILFGSSGNYGAVPREFLEFFMEEIIKGYREKFPGIEKIAIETPEITENDARVSFLEEFKHQAKKR